MWGDNRSLEALATAVRFDRPSRAESRSCRVAETRRLMMVGTELSSYAGVGSPLQHQLRGEV
jgi:hypothetical protein